MKSSLVYFIIINLLSIFIFSSCDKEDENMNEGNNESAIVHSYYVKYIIYSNYPYIFSNWTVNTPQGKYTKNNYQTRRWEQTYGPVKKGFSCYVQVGNGQPNIEIYVSKNQEPFALKTTKNGYSASYTVD